MYYVMESVFYSIPERDLTSYFDVVTEYLKIRQRQKIISEETFKHLHLKRFVE